MLRKSLLVLAATLSAVACGHYDNINPALEPLRVEWAACNVGASVPEEAGIYFAWGEIASKDHYSWDNYSYFPSGNVLGPEDDAATVLMGKGWRIPTKADWEELQLKGLWKMIVRRGVAGYQVISRRDGKEIVFLPAAGFYRDGSLVRGQAQVITLEDGSLSWKDAECHFWTSEIRSDYNAHAWYYGLADQGYGQFYDASRALGMNIRAVRDK